MESLWGFGCWATVQSVIAGVESSGAPRAGGSVSSATNSSTSGVASGGTTAGHRKKKTPASAGGLKREVMSLFRLVVLHLVFLHFVFLFFLVRLVVVLCFDVFLFVHRLVHLVHRFAGRLVTLGKGKRRHRDAESDGEQQREYSFHI